MLRLLIENILDRRNVFMKIKDIGRVVTGKTPLTGVNEYYGGNIMFISPSDLHGDYLIEKSEKTITEEGLKSIESNSIDGISVLTGCIGWDMGNVAMCNSRCATNQQINAIIDFNHKLVDPRYVYYWLKGKKDYLFSIASVTRTPILSKSVFENIDIPLPSLKIQERVTKLLSLIDEKIRKNHQINDYLEQQLQLLYDYWFTQYNFPNEDGQPYKASNGLMVWNKMINHLIPADWKVKPLGTICSFRNGINYDKNVDGNTIYKIINVRNISSSTLFLDESNFDEICLPKQQGDKYYVSDDSIIIARSGIPGATRILCNPSSNIIFCGFIICCTPSDNTLQNYLTLYLRQFEGSSATQTGGSILKNVSQETLKNLIVPIPPQSLLNQFNDSILPIYNLINSNTKENVQLITLRDWLLPMLMNGQTTIED
jgi:type I restriction enzyme S subunit